MRISYWSSDVCSSDLPQIDRQIARGAQEGLDLEPLRDDPGLQPVGRAGARRGAVIDRYGPQIVLAGLDVGDLEIDAVEGVELVIAIFLPEGGDRKSTRLNSST